MHPSLAGPTIPWWRVRVVWLVVGGPALVVVASFVTLFVAVRGVDAPLHESATAQALASTPALQARNHAVTPRH